MEEHEHKHNKSGSCCVAGALVYFFLHQLDPAPDYAEAVSMSLGVLWGAHAAMRHPEWVQALVEVDNARVGAAYAAYMESVSEDMVRSILLTVEVR